MTLNLAILVYKNISSTSNDIKRKHLNTYLYYQNYFDQNQYSTEINNVVYTLM